jgi:hypothetical protein
MSRGDLAYQRQSNATALSLGGKERHEYLVALLGREALGGGWIEQPGQRTQFASSLVSVR